MIVRLFALGLLGWMLGFVWFAGWLPEPAPMTMRSWVRTPVLFPGRGRGQTRLR